MTNAPPAHTRNLLAVAAALASITVGAACNTDADRAPAVDRSTTTSSPSLGEPIARSSHPSSELYVVRSDGATTVAVPAAGSERFTIAMPVSDPVLTFTDRPHRGADRISADELVDSWAAMGFTNDPPNAALAGSSDGTDVDLAVELYDPRWDADTATLTISARTIGQDRSTTPPAQLDDASLFIDDAQSSATIRLSTGTTALTVTAVDVPFNPAGPDGQEPPMQVQTDAAGTGAQLHPDMALTGDDGFAAISVTNPQPGAPFTASFTLADGPLQWNSSVSFAADGQVSGSLTQLALTGEALAQAQNMAGSAEYGYTVPELMHPNTGQPFPPTDVTMPLQFDADVTWLQWN